MKKGKYQDLEYYPRNIYCQKEIKVKQLDGKKRLDVIRVNNMKTVLAAPRKGRKFSLGGPLKETKKIQEKRIGSLESS